MLLMDCLGCTGDALHLLDLLADAVTWLLPRFVLHKHSGVAASCLHMPKTLPMHVDTCIS